MPRKTATASVAAIDGSTDSWVGKLIERDAHSIGSVCFALWGGWRIRIVKFGRWEGWTI